MAAVKIEITLRLATRTDFKNPSGVWLYGTFFWLKSQHTGEFEGPYLFYQGRNLQEFIEWYKGGMIWVRK